MGQVYVERMALTRSPIPPTTPGANPKTPGDQGVGNPVAGDGFQLSDVRAVAVSVQANPGQTLTGAGALWCWLWHEYLKTWERADNLDLSMAWTTTNGVAATQQQTKIFQAIRIPVRLGGRLLYTTQSVGVSGGSDVLVRIDGSITFTAS